MKFRSAFTTVDAVLEQLAIANKSEYDLATEIDTLRDTEYGNKLDYIKTLIFDQSERIAKLCGQQFIPYRWTYAPSMTRVYKYQLRNFPNYYQLELDATEDDLLEIESLTWGDTALTSSQYRVGDGLIYPARHVEIDSQASISYNSSFSSKVTLVGIWGFHPNPDAMWIDSTDAMTGDITDSDTSITVSAGTRFEVYQYLKIDDEFLFISSISGNILTVQRGVNGTTAAAHTTADTIYQYQVTDLVDSAVRRRVAWLLQNPSEMKRIVALPDGSIQLDDEGSIPIPHRRALFGSI